MHLGRWLYAAVLTTFVGLAPQGAGAAPQAGDLYIRGRFDIPQAVARLLEDSAAPAGTAFVFAFEAASFSAPAGDTVFTAFYGFHRDAEAWCKALGAAGLANPARPLFVTTSVHEEPIDVRTALGERRALEALRHRWTSDDAVQRLLPAAVWMEACAKAVKKESRAQAVVLVYLSDLVSPEQRWWQSPKGERWPHKLAADGTYFDEEAVGRALTKAGARLFVVAPEALFEDFTPFAELPSLPWAARPQLPPVLPDIAELGGLPDPPVPGVVPGPGREMTLEEAEALLAAIGPTLSPEARKALEDLIARLRAAKKPSGTGPTPATPPAPAEPDPHPATGRRFHAATPQWFPSYGSYTPWTNHVPSFFGWWPYARAAAITGGRYLFYPFRHSPWLDDCPADARLLADLAPELVARTAFARLGSGDAAWDALDDAVRAVQNVTPWAFHIGEHVGPWSSFESRRPLEADKRWVERRRPTDDAFLGSTLKEAEWREEGRRLLTQALPAYKRALKDLDDALEKVEGPTKAKVHRRAHADLLLGRFWLSMSRFHLHALGLYADEIERFRPDPGFGIVDAYVITYVPAIRLSDCLEAYDGRRLPPEKEAQHAWPAEHRRANEQGNLLTIPTNDPDYRAQRDVERVLANIDPRLRADALDLIEAAKRLMARFAKTPWGWTVYYTEADTFIWHPLPPGRSTTYRPGKGPKGEPEDPPETPPDVPGGPTTPGGTPPSAPSGPTTPR